MARYKGLQASTKSSFVSRQLKEKLCSFVFILTNMSMLGDGDCWNKIIITF